MATDPENVAKQFVEFYYSTFDSDRNQLSGLYRDTSMLTFESSNHTGAANIQAKLLELPFQKVMHKVATLNVQPGPGGSLLVLVTGALLVDDQEQPMSYTQCFTLMPEGGSFYVHNDLFRLVYSQT